MNKHTQSRSLLLSLLLSLLILSLPSISHAQSTLTTLNTQISVVTAFNDEQVTIDATAGGVGFTAAKINPSCTNCNPDNSRASRADCKVESADIRLSLTATAPTSAVGLLIANGSTFTLYGYTNISTFKAIRTAAVSATLSCIYYR